MLTLDSLSVINMLADTRLIGKRLAAMLARAGIG